MHSPAPSPSQEGNYETSGVKNRKQLDPKQFFLKSQKACLLDRRAPHGVWSQQKRKQYDNMYYHTVFVFMI